MMSAGPEKKAVIKNADMAEETQNDAIDTALQVCFFFAIPVKFTWDRRYLESLI